MALLAKKISFFVAIDPNVGGDPAEGDKFSTGVNVIKETLYFQDQCITCIKTPKGLQGTSGVRINNEIITYVKRNARKGEETIR